MKKALWIAAAAILFAACGRAFADDSQIDSEALFKKLDANGDGKLTASEIPPEQRKFFDRLLRVSGAEKSGELTREQFDRALNQRDEPVTDISKVGGLGGGPPAGGAKMDAKRIFAALDANKDGKLTRDELSGRPRLLALMERLGKNELTLEDLSALGKAGKGKNKKNRLATGGTGSSGNKRPPGALEGTDGDALPALFRLLDTNHDGRLSREELAKADELFDRLDRNHDGFLDPQELSAAHAQKGSDSNPAKIVPAGEASNARGPLPRLMQLIMRADKDGDGRISQAEAPKQLKKHFAKIDKDGDGYLDKHEIEVWLKHRLKRQGVIPKSDNSQAQNVKPKSPGF